MPSNILDYSYICKAARDVDRRGAHIRCQAAPHLPLELSGTCSDPASLDPGGGPSRSEFIHFSCFGLEETPKRGEPALADRL